MSKLGEPNAQSEPLYTRVIHQITSCAVSLRIFFYFAWVQSSMELGKVPLFHAKPNRYVGKADDAGCSAARRDPEHDMFLLPMLTLCHKTLQVLTSIPVFHACGIVAHPRR